MTSGNCPCTEGQHAITVGNHDIDVSSERNHHTYNFTHLSITVKSPIHWRVLSQRAQPLPLWLQRIRSPITFRLKKRSSAVFNRRRFLVDWTWLRSYTCWRLQDVPEDWRCGWDDGISLWIYMGRVWFSSLQKMRSAIRFVPYIPLSIVAATPIFSA